MLVRFDQLRDNYDRSTEQFDHAWRRGASTVPMDSFRHGNEVILDLDLPGMDPDAIDLTVERDVLTISANRQWARKDDDEVFASERPQGTFTRRLLLGSSLDTSKLQASYDLGVLTITLPVNEQAKPRKISIGSGNGKAAIEATTSA
jgi:HSP20 family protein